jgi:hypothetical protein
MSSRYPVPGDKVKRGRAVKRLLAAVEESRRARDARDSPSGSRDDLRASASLPAADDEIVARERWLKAVDDHGHRGAPGP